MTPWAEPAVRSVVDADDVERMLTTAVCALRDRDHDTVLEVEDLLASEGDALVDAVAARYVRRDMAAAADRGWDDVVLARYVRRRLGKAHGRVFDALDEATDGTFVDDLARRLRIGRSYAVHHVIEVLVLVASLPPLPALRSAERRPRALDGRMLERVRALLAKAESTTFPEEAEALTTKAQELMTRYAIDRALLDATAGVGAGAGVSGRRVVVEDPYAKEKSLLLGKVVGANRCRAVWSPDLGWSTVFGADDDLDIVELLFTSLLFQAASAMAAAGSTADRSARTRSFRQAFLAAYAIRIGERLRQANDEAARTAADVHGSKRLLPVLAERRTAAEAAVREAFPHLDRTRFSAHDHDGWAAGTAAADVASLDTRRAVHKTVS